MYVQLRDTWNCGIDSASRAILGYLMVTTQMSMKEGIKTFGERAIEAVFKEVSQIHNRDVVEPMFPNQLTEKQKKDALNAITMVEEKCSGDIKKRTVADGRKQRGKIPKEKSASSTVSTEALLLSLMIDAQEDC